jgi:hypothetical protein
LVGWFSGKGRKEEQRRLARAELFEDRELCLMLHFPSMASVSYAVFPIVYCGEVQRLDGPRWLLRYLPLKNAKTAETRDPKWEAASGSLASRIETAYQRYLALPATGGADTNTDPRWFYESARHALQEIRKQECAMIGIDEDS